ncbi:MAG: hypothetical protein JRG82_08900 [Deltaproteobacteria bacterium]|nr:hypothetical protein [Deltaproteobacteria bacterium]
MTTLHVVPHTHWDREWYLPFQEFRIKLVHLVDGLLDLLERDPDYRYFTLDGQTIVIDDYLQVRPGRRALVERLIAEGRLLVGPWTILPDEFLVSPESLVRNLRYGARRAAALGGRMAVGYVPDPFGHVGQLPQILRGFGIECAAFRRGLGDDPVELWWESPDGSRVLVSYLRDGYDNATRLPVRQDSFERVLRSLDDSLAKHSVVSHRLMLNGTDHHEPQPELPALLRGADTGQDEWLHSTLPAYMQALREEVETRGLDLPVVRGELRDPQLHHLLPGVLSSRTWLKLRNDECERELERWAEPFSAWAEHFCADQADTRVWTGNLETPRVREPQALLDRAWALLLENHPHDSICGCSVDAVHDEMRPRFDQSEQISREVTRQSLTALALEVDTSALAAHGAQQALVVFNSAGVERTDLARARIELGGGLDPFEIVVGRGRVLPYRVLRREARELARLVLEPEAVGPLARGIERGRILGLAVESVSLERSGEELSIELIVSEGGSPKLDRVSEGLARLQTELDSPGLERVRVYTGFATRVDLEVRVAGLPAHGYRALGVRPCAAAPAALVEESASTGAQIGNERFAVRADADGRVSLLDQKTGRSFDGLLALRDRGERGDSYTTDPLDDADRVPCLRDVKLSTRSCDAVQSLEVRGVLDVPKELEPDRTRRCDETVELPVGIVLSLVEGVPRVDVEVEIDNSASDHRLELLFPTGVSCATAVYDGHFEQVERSTTPDRGGPDWQEQPREELPVRSFVEAGGLVVASHGLREASVSPDGVIAMTLLRCFGWLSRNDLATRAGGAGPQLPTPGGQSPGRQRFRLSLIPVVDGESADARAQADAFQAPPRGIGTQVHPGPLAECDSLLRVDGAGFRTTAVCLAEDGASLVVRGVWLGEAPGRVRVSTRAAASRIERVRLDETPLATLEPNADGAVALDLRPGEVATLRFGF